MEKTRRAPWAAVALAVAFIFALTLLPTPGHPEAHDVCIVCGMRGLADAVLNVVLFMPLGAALAWAGLGLVRAVPLGFALTVAIEIAQRWVPGRDSSVGDVMTNTLGTACGVLALGAAPAVLAWARRRATLLSLALPAATVAGVALGAVLLRPALSAGPYVPAWHRGRAHPEWFPGKVARAELGGVQLLRRRVRDGDRLRELWRTGAPLRLEVVRTERSLELEPVFALYDRSAHELLLLAFQGDDVLLRFRTLSGALRLDEPALRLQGAAPAVVPQEAPGAQPQAAAPPAAAEPAGAVIEARRQGSGYCLSVNGRGRCGLGYGVARSWAVFMYPSLPPAAERALDLLWLFLLFLPSGLLLRRRTGPVALALTVGALALLPALTGLLATPAAAYAAALLGLAAGAGLARLARRLGLPRQMARSAGPSVMARASTRRQRSIRS